MPSDAELLGRLLLAGAFGGAIGAERELADQPAGLRTHVLLTLGACLFTLVSAYGFGGSTDPSRMAAQIVTGVGFLGGGAILRHGLSVRGVTTAASIWATTSIGVAVGVGRYLLASGTALLVVGTLLGLRAVRDRIRNWSAAREELVLVTRAGFDVGRVAELIRAEHVALRGLDTERDADGGRVVIVVRLPPRYRPERLVEALVHLEGVREVEWER